MPKTVYFVPAPDMDERSIQAVQLDGCDVIPLMLPPIETGTQLGSYIRELKQQIRHERPIIVGGCYGGPLAIELSKIMDVERVVIVACIKDSTELTAYWRILFYFYTLIPSRFESWLGHGCTFLINKMLRIKVKIPRIWLKSAQNKFIAQHFLRLQVNQTVPKLIHIHGSQDAIFPIRKIPKVDIVIASGHFMIDKHRRATMAAITRAVHD